MSSTTLVLIRFILGVQTSFRCKNPCPRWIKSFQLWWAIFVFRKPLVWQSLNCTHSCSWNLSAGNSLHRPRGCQHLACGHLQSLLQHLPLFFFTLIAEYWPFQFAILAILRAKKLCRVCLLDSYKVSWFGPWPQQKGHAAALSPLPLLGWGGEWEEKGKTRGWG